MHEKLVSRCVRVILHVSNVNLVCYALRVIGSGFRRSILREVKVKPADYAQFVN